MAERTHIFDFEEGEIVPVFHFGIPDQMKVVGHHQEKKLVKLQYLVLDQGIDYKSVATLNRMADQCAAYKAPGQFK